AAQPSARLDRAPPGLVLDVPADRAREALLEGDSRCPAELAAGAARVDRVAEVVARPVAHEAPELAVARDAPGPERGVLPCRSDRLERRADGLDELEVRALGVRPERILLPRSPGLEGAEQTSAMILDPDPVA